MTNCTFSGNSAAFDGGGVWFENPSPNSKLDNCVFWNNVDDSDESNGGPFMDESAQIFVQAIPSLLEVTYTDIMGLDQTAGGPFCVDPMATPPCEGNIDDNPVFLEDPVLDSGSWTLQATYDAATDQTTFTDGGGTYGVDIRRI